MADRTNATTYVLNTSIGIHTDSNVPVSQTPGGTDPADGIPSWNGDATITEVGYDNGSYYYKISQTIPDPKDDSKNIVRSGWITESDITGNGTFNDSNDELNFHLLKLDEGFNELSRTKSPEQLERERQQREENLQQAQDLYGISEMDTTNHAHGSFELFTGGATAYTNYMIDYDNFILKMTRVFGLPPQWTGFVDSTVQHGKFLVGRRYLQTILGSTTILSMCPGKIKPGMPIVDAAANVAEGDVAGAVESIKQASSDDISDPFWKFEPNFDGSLDGSYINCCNVLIRFALACLSTSPSGDTPMSETNGELNLLERQAPWGGTYMSFNAQQLLNPQGEGYVDDFDSYAGAFTHVMQDSEYVHFNANGGMQIEDTFNTETRQSILEQTVNGNISAIMKDVAFMTGASMGAEVESDLQALKSTAVASLGGTVGSLLGAAMEVLKGGSIAFPKVIDDSTWGRSFQFSVKFVSIYGDVESRFLQVVMPYLLLMCFFLPKQLKNKIDMYTYPPVVRAFARGVYACDCGVLTGINVKRGGDDDSAWTASGQPMEIDVSFNITSLHERLMQSSDNLWFVKNTGLQLYIGTLCGIDMTVTQEELIKKTAEAMAGNMFADVKRNVEHDLFKFVNQTCHGWIENNIKFGS